jgi:hemerythrin
MEHFTWSNKYSVANEELDTHHKHLFDIFNKLYDSCLNNDKTINLGLIVEELVSYTNHHFHAEEQYMKGIKYIDIDKHISEHRYFLAMISKYHHKKEVNDAVVSKELVLHIWKWLVDHVMTEDKKYSIKSKQPAQRMNHDQQA